MTYEEALSYIHSFKRTKSTPSLKRIKELLSLMGNPEKSFPAVHVAGTNGKGSFSAMLERVLTFSGYKVGLYTSPFIEKFNERMQIGNIQIPDALLTEITEYVKPFADSMEDSPTEFDVTTAIGFEFFKRSGIDIAVVEAGLGGRFDSTNVFEKPLLSVITGVALDHTELLGDTVEKIAAEKAGIIKSGSPVLFGGNDISALEVIKSTSEALASPFFLPDTDKITIKKADLSSTVFDIAERKDVKITLLGMYQPYNAANVIKAVDILRKENINIPEEALIKGLEETKWKARFERLSKNPDVFYDGSHNPQGIEFAVKTIKKYFGEKKPILVMGVMKDKNFSDMIDELSTVADSVYALCPHNARALSENDLAKEFGKRGIPAFAFSDMESGVENAVKCAVSQKKTIIALGSLYLYSDFKKALAKVLCLI